MSVIDLRNPTRSDGNNMLHLVNNIWMNTFANPDNLSAKARAEKYAKIIAKTIVNSGGLDAGSYGQNAFFYDAAEGLLLPSFYWWRNTVQMRNAISYRSLSLYRTCWLPPA